MQLSAGRAVPPARGARPAVGLLLAGLVALVGCSRVASLLPGQSATAGAVATPDLSDAERIALSRARNPVCRFVHGFADTRNAVPDVIGDCVENERTDPASGDTLQRTTRGLLVWRKADGLVAFTDGHRTWVRAPDGLVRVRANGERFAWEAAPAGPNAPVLRVVTPGPPVPTAAPSPAAGTPSPSGPPPFKPAGSTAAPTKPSSSSEPPKPLPITATPVSSSGTKTCADFASQAEAQRAYRTNPVTNRGLDRDSDGVACQTETYKDKARDETVVRAG